MAAFMISEKSIEEFVVSEVAHVKAYNARLKPMLRSIMVRQLTK